MPTYHLRSPVAATAQQLFDWHARPGAIHRLLPPWQATRVLEAPRGLDAGQSVLLDLKLLGPIRGRWRSAHTWCERPTGFDDEQVEGPFARWLHRHRFEDGALDDTIDWAPPWIAAPLTGALATMLGAGFVWRHRRTAEDLRRHTEVDGPPLRVAISGASGLVGTALTHFLTSGGHEVVPLVRRRDQPGVLWDPTRGEVDVAGLEGVDAVVHLAGASIAERPWTDERKALLRASRVDGTATLARALASMQRPPRTFISGSAVGFYGDRGDTLLDERAEPGQGFLADVAVAWEAAAKPAADAGIRTVWLRTGIVLAGDGGALPAMLPPFRAGVGGPLGGGAQWVPWIHLDDLVYAIHFALTRPVEGPLLGVAPASARQSELASAIGRALGRPAFIPTPAAAVRAMLGREMADELVLSGQRASPEALVAAGFRWAYPNLDDALSSILG
jgi:uncharacterized protein (TIGR01777 family)